MRLRELRETHGYTQDYVSEFINVSRITYIRYETEARAMKAPELIRLAELYHVSVDYLLGIDTKKDLPPVEQEQAGEAGETALKTQPVSGAMPQDIGELSALIRQIVDRALDERTPPSDSQS